MYVQFLTPFRAWAEMEVAKVPDDLAMQWLKAKPIICKRITKTQYKLLVPKTAPKRAAPKRRWVEFIRDFRLFKVGQTMEVDDHVAQNWIDAGHAKAIKEPARNKAVQPEAVNTK